MSAKYSQPISTIIKEQKIIYSQYLERDVILDAYLPTNIVEPEQMSLLLINDGQDLLNMPFETIITELIEAGDIEPHFLYRITLWK